MQENANIYASLTEQNETLKATIASFNDRFVKATNMIRELSAFNQRLDIENGALQAKIDELMLEYCPNEMTKEQLQEWAKHQVWAGKRQVRVGPPKNIGFGTSTVSNRSK